MADSALDVTAVNTRNPARVSPLGRLWDRDLPHYPPTGARYRYLTIVVLITIVLYYELYVQGSVAPQIIAKYGMTLKFFVGIAIFGNLIGAVSAVGAGLADRYGRANITVIGTFITGLIILFVVPITTNKWEYSAALIAVGVVEGTVLVATPALIRDFSPQLGRASAMGFWTLGPVLGSLVVTEVSSHTLAAHPDWQFQFRVCGVVGLIVAVIGLLFLRELSPGMRDQIMVSARDRVLIEMKAAGIDPVKATQGGFRQMMKADVMGPALAISLFLLFYYFAVGFFVIYFALNYNYPTQKANSLANWYWATNAIALLVIGVVSDRFRVRKPFMVIGTIISATGVFLFANAATNPHMTYNNFVVLMIVISAGGGIAYCAWMAAFTETVEKHNPAGIATGLAVWGFILRFIVMGSLIGLLYFVSAAPVLVDHGLQVQGVAAKYPTQIAVLGKLSPTTQAALGANPNNTGAQAKAISELTGLSMARVDRVIGISTQHPNELATLQAIDPTTAAALGANPNNGAAINTAIADIAAKFNISTAEAGNRLIQSTVITPGDIKALQTDSPAIVAAGNQLKSLGTIAPADAKILGKYAAPVQKAQKESPPQWKHWWFVAFAGQIAFLPFIFLMTGRWSPRKARQDARDHEEAVERELAALQAAHEPVEA